MADIIQSIAAVLWPLLVLIIVLTFRRTLHRILDSMEHREVEIDVGGQRLTLRQLNDQQAKLITDLQRQVAALTKAVDPTNAGSEAGTGARRSEPCGPAGANGDHDGAGWRPHDGESLPAPPYGQAAPPPGATVPTAPGVSADSGAPGTADGASTGSLGDTPGVAAPDGRPTGSRTEPPTHAPQAVLWVDDQPEGNALLVEQLQDAGTRVDIARSTNEALARLADRRYRLIVSDMAWVEGSDYDPDAGVALIRDLRDTGIETPVVVYCGPQGRLRHGAAALEAGAIAVTDSSVQLFEQLQTFELV